MKIPKTKTLIRREMDYNVCLNSPTELAAYIGSCEAEGLTWEGMWVIGLSGRSAPVFIEQVAQGGGHALAITAREILFRCCAQNVSAFILIHNHPGGSVKPSIEDFEMTRSVARAGEVIGITLLDHVIVRCDGTGRAGRLPPFYSMLEEGDFDGM